MQIPVSICTSYFMADKFVLVDSGETDNFMHPNFAKEMGLRPVALERPQKIWNADNVENKAGMITHYLDLDVEAKGIHKDMRFYITNIGREDIFLGYPWLAAYKPHFQWKDAAIREEVLPVIIWSINPHVPRPRPVITQATLDNLKASIVRLGRTELSMYYFHRFSHTSWTTYQGSGTTTPIPRICESVQWRRIILLSPSMTVRPHDWVQEGDPWCNWLQSIPLIMNWRWRIEEFFTEQLEKGYICFSKSQYTSSFFFITKKDRKLCPVQDYRCINNYTIHNQYPLPLISDLITDLHSTHIYMKLDIRWGYNNVHIKEGDEHKAAFKTRYGLYELTVMFFGLTNSPATFQTMMNHIFHPVIAKHKLLETSIHVYMDDIAIATQTNDHDHTAAVLDILALAQEHDLYFKLEKCLFHVPSIDCLGVIFEKGVTCMGPVKIAGIKDWKTPDKS